MEAPQSNTYSLSPSGEDGDAPVKVVLVDDVSTRNWYNVTASVNKNDPAPAIVIRAVDKDETSVPSRDSANVSTLHATTITNMEPGKQMVMYAWPGKPDQEITVHVYPRRDRGTDAYYSRRRAAPYDLRSRRSGAMRAAPDPRRRAADAHAGARRVAQDDDHEYERDDGESVMNDDSGAGGDDQPAKKKSMDKAKGFVKRMFKLQKKVMGGPLPNNLERKPSMQIAMMTMSIGLATSALALFT